MKPLALYLCSLLSVTQLHAQTVQQCASDWFPDPETHLWMEAQIAAIEPEVVALRGGSSCPTWRIPVVFHVVADPADLAASNIPDSWIMDQIAHLNNEFVNNLDGEGATPCIEFCLAQNTWNGQDWLADFNSATPGITRWVDANATVANTLAVNDLHQLATLVEFPTDRYFNVWIVSDVIGALPGTAGFGTFPVSSLPLDGVIIEYSAISHSGVEGDLLIHEAGHYLGLYHTFQGGCADSDQCTDTPPEDAPAGSCIPPMSCGVPELVADYMDYTPEFCQNTFTTCQVNRMQAQLVLWRPMLFTSVNGIRTGILGPNGCAMAPLVADFISNGTQFCMNVTTALFEGVIEVDTWTWTIIDPSGASIATISGGPGIPDLTYLFNAVGPWTVTLDVTVSGSPPASSSITVWVSDCPPINMEQAQWYFGDFCALDFSSGVPQAIQGSTMESEEGAASICDGSGSILFYASNHQAFNSVNTPLTPTFIGVASSSQSPVFVPDPGNSNQLYLFNTSDVIAPSPQELHYSLMDIAGQSFVSGLSDVSVGSGEPNVSEHLSAVPDCGSGYWVVTHTADVGSSALLSYHLDASGIQLPPVSSPSFSIGGGPTDGIGVIEFSSDGELAAITNSANTSCGLYAFDRRVGIFTHIVDIQAGTSWYGAAMSPSGDFLYTATGTKLYQHDLRNLDPCTPEIPPNNYIDLPRFRPWCALQRGPDNKVYMAEPQSDFVSVINYPEVWNS